MKKYVKRTIGLTVGMLLSIIMFMIIIDPLFQYHYPWFGFEPILTGESTPVYYSPGMAKTFEYDNAIIGTSLSKNFRASWISEVFGGESQKLTIGGIHSKEYLQLFSLAVKHEGTKNIVVNIDNTYLMNKPGVGRWTDLPDYLYDYNYLNDTNYIFNKNFIFGNAFRQIRNNILRQYYTDFDTLFCNDAYPTNSEGVAKDIDLGIVPYTKQQILDLRANRETNIKDLVNVIENNKEINFCIIVAPLSIAWWYEQIQSGLVEYWEETYLQLFDELVCLDNVEIYFFSDDQAMKYICDLNEYTDVIHYSTKVSRYIVDCFKNGSNRITAENYMNNCKTFFERIRKYPYEEKVLNILFFQ